MGLDELTQTAFDSFDEARSRLAEIVVQPSVPILFFGDESSYRKSPLRIITVGLNPSLAEFPAEDPFARFRRAEGLSEVAGAGDINRYLAALRCYYLPDQKPYTSWFGTYEPILDGLEASFYPGRPNTALHTDLCSPVATNPTWSRLSPAQRSVLARTGRQLWHDLVRELKPHVMLVSVAESHLEQIRFPAVTVGSELLRIDRAKPYVVKRRRYRIDEDHSFVLIFGQAAQTPFGSVSAADKRRIGAAIKASISV